MDKKVSVTFLAIFMVTFMIYFTFQYPVKIGGFFVYEGQTYTDTCFNVTPSSFSFSNNEVLYFRFNNHSGYGEGDRVVCDLSGNRNTGFVSSGKWNASGGRYGDGAFEFDGNDKIFVLDDDTLSPKTTGQFTVSFWIKFNSIKFPGEAAGYLHYMGKGGYNGNDYEYMFRQYNSSNSASRPNRISFYVFNRTGGWGVGSYAQDSITTGEWMHIVAVVNQTHTAFWKNGVMRDSDYYADMIFPSNEGAPFNIGTVTENGYLVGSIDELRIYNKSLTSAEIAAIYSYIPSGDLDFSNSTSSTNSTTNTSNTSISVPTLTISSPSNSTYFGNQNILLSFVVSGQENLKYSIDNSANTTINSSRLFNTTNGQHTLYLTATNSAGSTSKSVTFTVSSTSSNTTNTSTSTNTSNTSSTSTSTGTTSGSSSGGGGGGGGGGGSSGVSTSPGQTKNNTSTNENNGNSGGNKPNTNKDIEDSENESSGLAPRSRGLSGYAVKGSATNVLMKSSVFAFLCTIFAAMSYLLYLFIVKKDESALELMRKISEITSKITGKLKEHSKKLPGRVFPHR